MKSEYKLDRRSWGPGPWVHEPEDVVDPWMDEATGLQCFAARSQNGAWCGYVALGDDHPYRGLQEQDLLGDIQVHGGVTFCGPVLALVHCTQTIAPLGWAIGFSTSDTWLDKPPLDYGFWKLGSYKNLAFVRNEIKKLAKQLA